VDEKTTVCVIVQFVLAVSLNLCHTTLLVLQFFSTLCQHGHIIAGDDSLVRRFCIIGGLS